MRWTEEGGALPGAFCAAEQREERHDLLLECGGDILIHDRPDLQGGIHAGVCMNQNVPKADHLLPGNTGRSASKIRRDATFQRERSVRRPLVFEDVRLLPR